MFCFIITEKNTRRSGWSVGGSSLYETTGMSDPAHTATISDRRGFLHCKRIDLSHGHPFYPAIGRHNKRSPVRANHKQKYNADTPTNTIEAVFKKAEF